MTGLELYSANRWNDLQLKDLFRYGRAKNTVPGEYLCIYTVTVHLFNSLLMFVCTFNSKLASYPELEILLFLVQKEDAR